MSWTGIPESRSSLAVPPVEISSTPIAESLRANSASPVLSVTLRIARWIFWDILASVGNFRGGRTKGILSGQPERRMVREVFRMQNAEVRMQNPALDFDILPSKF